VRRILKITALVTVAVVVVGGGAMVAVYQAAQRVPEFYRAALAVSPEAQQPARDAFVAQATALASDLNGDGRWRSLFTVEQINAWLALELPQDFPELLPAELCEPRISIRDNEATIGCRYKNGDVEAVLSLTFEAYLHEPNVVAFRICRARAGALPLPLAQVLDNISHAARELNLQLEWRRAHGDPVALITLPEKRSQRGGRFSVETLELRAGELFLAGTTGRADSETSPIVPEPLRIPTARADDVDQPRVGSAEKETRQE
jgi:hypothetical protein